MGRGEEVPLPTGEMSEEGLGPPGKMNFYLKWRVLMNSEQYFCP